MSARDWLSGLFSRRRRPAPVPEAEERDYTEAELRELDGADPDKPVLLAIRGVVYDVTRGRSFYGKGGPYGAFAGKDCARALAKDSLEPEDLTGDVAGLTPVELERLEEWIELFEGKYHRLGRLLPESR